MEGSSVGSGARAIGRIAGRLSAVHSNHKRIASGAALIGALLIVAKIFVAAREIAIAWRFGIGELVDAYQMAVTIVTWLPMMLTSVLTVVLVPRLVALQSSQREHGEFIAELNGTVVAVGAALSLLVWLAAPLISSLLASRSDAARLQTTAMISRQIAPVAFLMLISGYLSARLQSRERFAYSITEAIPAAAIAVLVLAPGGLGSESRLVSGALAGFALQVVVLAAMIWHCGEGVGAVRVQYSSPEWRVVYRSLLLMGLGQLLITSTLPVDQGFASRISEGAVATLGYANRMLTVAISLGSMMVSRALLPVMSQTVASGDIALGRRQTLQWAGLLFGLAFIGAIVASAVAPTLVRLLFERGAFDRHASVEVARALRFGALQLPPYFGGIALVQWYSALGRFRAFVVITALALVIKVVLNFLLVPLLGLGGIMISTAAMYSLTALLLWIGMKGQFVRVGAD